MQLHSRIFTIKMCRHVKNLNRNYKWHGSTLCCTLINEWEHETYSTLLIVNEWYLPILWIALSRFNFLVLNNFWNWSQLVFWHISISNSDFPSEESFVQQETLFFSINANTSYPRWCESYWISFSFFLQYEMKNYGMWALCGWHAYIGVVYGKTCSYEWTHENMCYHAQNRFIVLTVLGPRFGRPMQSIKEIKDLHLDIL